MATGIQAIGEIGRSIEIGTAAAADLLRGLVDLHAVSGVGEPHGGRKAGDTGANDMNCLLHQMKA